MRRLVAFTVAALGLAAIAAPLAEAGRPNMTPGSEETSPCSSLDPDTGQPLSAREVLPPEIRLCETAVVSTTVRVSCGEIALHVVLNVDRSGSMVGQAWTEAVNAATALIQALDLDSHPLTEVALVTHGINANRDVRLTNQGNRVIGRLRGLSPGGEDNLPAAIDLSRTELIQGRPRGRDEAQPFDAMVILSDGGQTFPPSNAVRAAGRAKAAGILVVAVCTENASSACPQVRQMASGTQYYFQTRGTSGLTRVFREIADDLRDINLRQMTVSEALPQGLDLVPDSAAPPPQLDPTGRTLSWQFRFVPRAGVTYTYAVTPSEVTTYSLAISTVTFQDSQDRSGLALVPTAVLTVTDNCAVPTATPTLGPSATPSPTPVPSATATPTPIPGVAYLPILGFGRCLERPRPLDVVLAIDASTSMRGATSAGRSKLEAAKEGARHFVDLMADGERTAVVAFNSTANLLRSLTDDKDALRAAIDGIVMSPGTRIDRALAEAAGELLGPAQQPGASPVIVLLTDGQPTGTTPEAVLAAAQEARGAGITVFTIGLGADVDSALLVEVAGSADRYFFAPDGEDLARIYAAVREKLPCDPGFGPARLFSARGPAGLLGAPTAPPLGSQQGHEPHLP